MGRLFDQEDGIVILEECTTKPSIRDVGPEEMLHNWMATPLMIHRMAWLTNTRFEVLFLRIGVFSDEAQNHQLCQFIFHRNV